jgi:5'-3' exonuclease
MTLFIDTSYYIFYRYYAALSWYKKRKDVPAFEVANVLSNDVFLKTYTRKFEEVLVKWVRKHKIPWNRVYLAKDCHRDAIWRMQIFPEYKQNREERLSTFNGQIFKYTYQTIVPALQAKYGIRILEYPHAEADDVMAVLHAKLRRQDPHMPIMIVTNDNDLLQLLDDHTTIVNLNNLQLKTRYKKEELEVFTAFKVILGDKSDNIPSVLSKCGEKTALKLASNAALLEKKLKSLPECASSYDRNNLLINFDRIPDDIRRGIEHLL